MPTLELETWRCDIDGHLARLRMNRPQALNAANWAWVKDLVTATAYLAQSSETHVVIVSGEGRAFCSGLDTKELAKGNLTREWFSTWEKGLIDEVYDPADLEVRALMLAQELLVIPFTALKQTKRQINRAFYEDDDTLLRDMVDGLEDCLRSPEHQAVMKAYLEELAQKGKP